MCGVLYQTSPALSFNLYGPAILWGMSLDLASEETVAQRTWVAYWRTYGEYMAEPSVWFYHNITVYWYLIFKGGVKKNEHLVWGFAKLQITQLDGHL